MAIFKCKMCGGIIEFDEGSTVGVCQYCGTKQTLPKVSDDQRANLYDRANHFRRNNEFDKAAGLYEQILNMDTTDAEAYWSLVLCRYGIEYVEDPSTHKRIPTINRTQFTSVFDDDNYKSALEYADCFQRTVYEEEANTINEIQKGILSISQKEEPFDVFLCYKETDDEGRRTPDSVLANDMYHQLTQEGFKVFFSRITLEDKLGTAYEPYIFAALNSAKVMVVLGTKPEYFNAVWVKNEWSRYLSIVNQSGGKKVLIPAYRDMDPYDLPEEFSHLQAQDMSRLGFMQDLIRGIKKITEFDESKAVAKETVVVNQGNTSTAPLLRRAFIFLEDGDWIKADEFCEQVLNIEPENAQAYLGKLMAEMHIHRQEDLSNLEKPFDDNGNYQKAVRFADAELSETLRNYISTINERNENARLTGIYANTIKAMDEASDEKAYKDAAEAFKTIPGYKDADVLAEQCLVKAQAYRQEAERKAEERRIQIVNATKKSKRAIRIAAPIAGICVLLIILMTTVVIPKHKLNSAMGYLEEGDYASAYHILKEIDRKDLIDKSKYERAVESIEAGDIERAISLLGGVDYKDSRDILVECIAKVEWPSTDVGDVIEFGRYEQDNNTQNGEEPIEWIVLEKDEDQMLVISKYALDCQPFNTERNGTIWETCSLRTWLNVDFLSNAFVPGEQNYIEETTVNEHENSSGTDTVDKVYILSVSEAQSFEGKVDLHECEPTQYAIAKGTKRLDGLCSWWLRTREPFGNNVAIVNLKGRIDDHGCYMDKDTVAVRPVIWLKTSE